MALQVARSARANYLIDNYVGDRGQLFWDEILGELRLSDGVTPGGLPVLGGSNNLSSLFISNLSPIDDIIENNDLFLLYDTSSGTLKKATFEQLGISGEVGYTGSQGDIGYTGSQGEVGPLGFTGSVGDIGYTGSKGLQGLRGYTGSKGAGFVDAQVSQQGELILTYEDSTSFTVGPVVGYTGSAGAPGGSGIAAVEENSGLQLSDDVLSTTYNTLISDSVESVSVGGASSAPASTWKNKNIVQVLDTILFPDIAPTYTIPTLSASGTQSGTREIGQPITQTITLTATENDAGIFNELIIKRGSTILNTVSDPVGSAVAAIADQYGYTNPNTPNLRYTFSYVDNFTVTSGISSWSGTGTYEAGLSKQNNKGIVDDRSPSVRSSSAPQAASTMNSNSISVTGIYPYFWGVSSTQPNAASIAAEIASGSTNKVLSSSTGTISITFNANAEFVWFAHFASYTNKTKWYNTELNQGSIGPGNFILSPVTQSVNSPNGYWNDIAFSIYISDAATATEGAIQFRNS